MDLLRRLSSNNNVIPAPASTNEAAKDATQRDAAAAETLPPASNPSPDSKVIVDAPPVDETKLPSTEIEEKWQKTIADAKVKTTFMARLKRLGSKKGKTKEAPLEEVDIAAMIPLPADPPASAPGTSVPGSNTLSKRIQVLLSSVPPFLHTVPDATANDPSTLPPVPPMPDSKLLGYLSSPDIMNGANSSGSGTNTPTKTPSPKQRASVWQVLDRLVPYKPPQATGTADGEAEEDPEEEAAETSLMVYAPLFPTADSKVELAKSQIIEVDQQEEMQKLPKEVAKEVASALWADKLKWWKKKKPATGSDSGSTTPTPAPGPPTKPKSEVKIWIPSKTEISFQVAWWGYRLWLPPPIMLILDDKTVEASKRAAMITTAIGWLINNIPTAVLPVPMKTAVTLLKAIVPILGYVGGFIAWSWGEIKSFDKGNGVVLSATWLLPIALIPSSWEDQETNLPIGRGDEQPAPIPTNPAPSTGTPSAGQPSSGTGSSTPVSMPQPQPAPATSS